MDRVDLVISDVVMPVMDGPAMVRAMRARRPGLPVLFMSGYAEEQLRQSIDIANVAFMPKPFSVAQLAEAVSMALDEAEHRGDQGCRAPPPARRGARAGRQDSVRIRRQARLRPLGAGGAARRNTEPRCATARTPG